MIEPKVCDTCRYIHTSAPSYNGGYSICKNEKSEKHDEKVSSWDTCGNWTDKEAGLTAETHECQNCRYIGTKYRYGIGPVNCCRNMDNLKYYNLRRDLTDTCELWEGNKDEEKEGDRTEL